MILCFDAYGKFDGESLQEKAVKAAIDSKSLLAIFPTGGGKSITFQVPVLMSGLSSKEITVVISLLQSLMKDQVGNLEKAGITEAVTINGLLEPIERMENDSASILYISPQAIKRIREGAVEASRINFTRVAAVMKVDRQC